VVFIFGTTFAFTYLLTKTLNNQEKSSKGLGLIASLRRVKMSMIELTDEQQMIWYVGRYWERELVLTGGYFFQIVEIEKVYA
jgi:hypothetical protein